jgi:exosortase
VSSGANADPTREVASRVDLIVLGVLLALTAVVYRPILMAMGRQWYDDENYSHGFLVAPLSAYLIWERRGQLRALTGRPSAWGLLVLVPSLGVLLLGSLGAELFLQRSSLLGVIVGLVLLVLGASHLGAISFPLAFLVFMIPLPAIVVNTIAFPLQLLAARAATACLYTLGIPVLREGNVITLASTTLEVAEACSGIRSLQSLLALGTIYAYLSHRILWKRWALALLSIPIAVAANAFRVSGTGVLAHFIGSRAAEGFYHSFSGWSVFVVAFVLLLLCGAILARVGKARKTGEARSTAKPGPAKAAGRTP